MDRDERQDDVRHPAPGVSLRLINPFPLAPLDPSRIRLLRRRVRLSLLGLVGDVVLLFVSWIVYLKVTPVPSWVGLVPLASKALVAGCVLTSGYAGIKLLVHGAIRPFGPPWRLQPS